MLVNPTNQHTKTYTNDRATNRGRMEVEEENQREEVENRKEMPMEEIGEEGGKREENETR